MTVALAAVAITGTAAAAICIESRRPSTGAASGGAIARPDGPTSRSARVRNGTPAGLGQDVGIPDFQAALREWRAWSESRLEPDWLSARGWDSDQKRRS
jgi:hypothetical protein